MPQGAPGSSQDLNSLQGATNTDTHTTALSLVCTVTSPSA